MNATPQVLTADDVLAQLAAATPLPLNGPLNQDDMFGVHESELQARGIKLVVATLTEGQRERWFKVTPAPADGAIIRFKTYFRKPFPGAGIVVDLFGIDSQDAVIFGEGWSTDGAPGSSVAHGSKGLSRRICRINNGFPIHLFRIALLQNQPAPAGPFLFLVTKQQE